MLFPVPLPMSIMRLQFWTEFAVAQSSIVNGVLSAGRIFAPRSMYEVPRGPPASVTWLPSAVTTPQSRAYCSPTESYSA